MFTSKTLNRPAFTRSRLTMVIPVLCVKYIQSYNKDSRMSSITLFWCFNCWLWTRKCRLGINESPYNCFFLFMKSCNCPNHSQVHLSSLILENDFCSLAHDLRIQVIYVYVKVWLYGIWVRTNLLTGQKA